MSFQNRIKQKLTRFRLGRGIACNMDVEVRMKRKLAELNFDFQKFDLDTFADAVGQQRQKEIVFINWLMPAGIFGVWISVINSPSEYIFCDVDMAPILQIHTKVHELAHIVCAHPTLELTLAEIQRIIAAGNFDALFTEYDKQTEEPQVILAREREAETLAALIQQYALEHERFDELMNVTATHPHNTEYLRGVGLV